MNIFKDFRLTTKIVFIIVLLTVAFSALVGFYIIPVIKNTLETDAEVKLKNLAETSYKIVEFYYKESQAGIYSEIEAKELAKKAVSNLRYNEKEYFWINDFTPTMIMHPTNKDLNGKDVSTIKDPDGIPIFMEFVKVAKNNKEGLVRYQWPQPGSDKPEPKFSYVKAFEPWQWVVGTGIYVGDLEQIRNQIVYKVIFSVLVVIVITLILVTIFILKPLNQTIHRILSYLEELSHYNFSKGIDLNQKDELGIIADSFNYIVENVRSLIKNTKDLGEIVVEESSQMISSTEEINIASERTAVTITELASGANEQAISTTNSTQKLQGIVSRLENINQDIVSSGTLAQKATQSVKVGSELVNDQGNKIASNKTVYNQIGDSISSLADKSKEINDIVLVIQDIAGQTNLLALNAAIEAARAGEHGRGFAVVAEEVRKLAEQVNMSGTKVINIVNEVETGIKETSVHMDLANKAVAEEEESLRKIVEFFGEISDSIQNIQAKIEAISDNSKEISKEAQSASEEISQIAVISKKSAQGTEDVAALSEETAATIQTVSERVKNLAAYAEELKQSIGKFKIE